jgi:uncharacterized tellurite resistance protein B-like protein
MLEAIRNFFFTSMNPEGDAPPAPRNPDLRLAACALLLELAWADDDFLPAERTHLEAAVRRHFSLDREEASELLRLAEAERARAADLWQFTNLIRQHYSTGQKLVLAEIMWGVVYSDGELSSREEYLMRKISHLLGLEMGYLAEARERARDPDPGEAVNDSRAD